jgi:two-component system OmpR family sensor kinase
MNRLWVRLTLAFAVVILVTVGAVAVLADVRANQAFRYYLSFGDPAGYPTLVDLLSEHYQTFGTWHGVEAILEPPLPVPGQMMGRRRGFAVPGGVRLQIVMSDADGRVVYDSLEGRTGRPLTRDEQAAALDIQTDGTVVGRLVMTLPTRSAMLGPLEQSFLSQLRQLLVAGGLMAGGLGVLLVLAISRSLTAPLQRLATAARGVAAGDLSRRVEVSGSAETAEVSQAFNEMAAGLEEAERQRQNLVADVAHELRTPLSVLQGNLQAILDDVYPLDKAEISRLYDQTRLLSRLVDDLRELALADAGQLHIDLQPTNADKVVRTTCDSLRPAAEALDVSLTAQTPDELPAVLADPDRVAQILHNLLVNALRHTPPGGSVTVTASATADAVQIAVTDTGEGFAPEDLPHVFDRFWWADPSRARDDRWEGSSGLGLSIAHSLVKAQGGRIWVESEPGEGATFRFTLPIERESGDRRMA